MNTSSDDFATLFEVGPRDGLQSLDIDIPTRQKIDLINALSATGFSKIETTSFVSPKWVPQLSDGAKVMRGISRNPNVRYSVLIPNMKGLALAIDAGADEVAVFISASEGFSRANLNCSIGESLARLEPVFERAENENIPVRGYLSAVIECPIDGCVLPEQVKNMASKLINMGCYEVSLGDTIGAGNKESVAALLDVLLDEISPKLLAGHFHDTNNTALAMIEECVERGIRTFDSSIGGLGGCPYAPGSTGNVDTRLVADLLRNMGLQTGIDLVALEVAESIANDMLI